MGLTTEQILERDNSLKNLTVTTRGDLKEINKNVVQKQGYVFVSYKSDNWKKVFEGKIFELQARGLRLYCDKNFDDTNNPWLVEWIKIWNMRQHF